MKVLRCNNNLVKKALPEVYTGHDLHTTAPEGIYKRVTTGVLYFVFDASSGSDRCVLWQTKGGNVFASARGGCEDGTFQRMPDAQLVFEVKGV